MSHRATTRETATSAARLRFEQNANTKTIAARLNRSEQTVRRLLEIGMRNGWWTLHVVPEGEAQERVPLHEELADQLSRRTQLYNAQVVKATGVEAAYTDAYLSPRDEERRAAYLAGDSLHEKLGIAAARYLVDSLKHEFTIGVASGRGVMHSVLALRNSLRDEVRTTKLQGLRVLSLCGGMKVSPWQKQLSTDLDAAP